MTVPTDEPPLARNRLLGSLPADETAILLPLLESVEITAGEGLYEPDDRIPFVYFPTTCVVAIAVSVAGRVLAGSGLVGSEGMVCIRAFLGRDSVPFVALAQNSGHVLRIRTDAFRATLARCPVLSGILNRYTDAFLTQVSYAAACNSVHTTAQRCCRWLLMTHDRVGADTFTLTHGSLAQMLGVQRTSITAVARPLQDRGLIEYNRGQVRVADRAALEKAACPCYAGIRAQFHPRPDPQG